MWLSQIGGEVTHVQGEAGYMMLQNLRGLCRIGTS